MFRKEDQDDKMKGSLERLSTGPVDFDQEFENSSDSDTFTLKNKMVQFLMSQDKFFSRNVLSSSLLGADKFTFGNVVHLDLQNQLSPEEEKYKKEQRDKKSQALWLADKWILNPDHAIRRAWEFCILFPCLVYTAIRVPYAIGFSSDEFDLQTNLAWFIINRLIDSAFITDMVIIFITAIRDGKTYNTDHLDIAIHYFKTWFIFDLFATVPFDLIIWTSSGYETSQNARGTKLLRVTKVFRTLRMLRLFKIKRIVATFEIHSGISVSMFSIIKFLVVFLLMAHFFACALLAVAITDREDESGDTVYNYGGWIENTLNTNTKAEMYVAALHWSIQTMTTIGYGDVKLTTDRERVFALLAMAAGGACFTYGITRVVHVVSMMDKSQTNLVEEISTISEWSSYYDFPTNLVDEVKKYYRYKHSTQYFDEKNILNSLSEPIRRDVMHYLYYSFFKRVSLFDSLSSNFLMEVMLRIETELTIPFTLVLQEGSVSDALYIIRRGHCGAFMGCHSREIKNVLLLSIANSFGETALLDEPCRLQASVVALEWCDLAKISSKSYRNLIRYFPREKIQIAAMVKSRNEELINTLFEDHNQYSLDSSEESTSDDEDSDDDGLGNDRLTSKRNVTQKERIKQRSRAMSDFMNNQLGGVESQINQINQWIKTVEGIVEDGVQAAVVDEDDSSDR